MYSRKCNVTLNLRRIPKRPTPLDVHLMIKQELCLAVDEVIAIHYDNLKGLVFIKVQSEDIVKRIIDKFDVIKFKSEEGELFDVEVTSDILVTTVRIHQVGIDVPDDVITEALRPFGIIQGPPRMECWPDKMPYPVLSGVRAVRIQLRRSIPSFIDIAGQRVLVTYPGQIRTCMVCSSTEHLRNECTRRNVQYRLKPRVAADVTNTRFAPTSAINMTVLGEVSPTVAPSYSAVVAANFVPETPTPIDWYSSEEIPDTQIQGEHSKNLHDNDQSMNIDTENTVESANHTHIEAHSKSSSQDTTDGAKISTIISNTVRETCTQDIGTMCSPQGEALKRQANILHSDSDEDTSPKTRKSARNRRKGSPPYKRSTSLTRSRSISTERV